MDVEVEIAKETRDRVFTLEGEFQDLQTMFKDMEQLVDKQGEGLDHIEGNVEESIVNVEVAVESLKTGIQYQKASRWKIIVFGIIVFLIIVLAAVGIFVGIKYF